MLGSKSFKIFRAAGLYWLLIFLAPVAGHGQVNWVNVDAEYGPLPASVQVFKTTDSLDGKPFIAYYVKAKLKDKKLDFTVDTTLNRRLTPVQFHKKNEQPLLVVNGTFFSFETNQNLNMVVKKGNLISYNVHTIKGKGKDTLTYRHPMGSAISINKKREADVAWVFTDSTQKFPYAMQLSQRVIKDSISNLDMKRMNRLIYPSPEPTAPPYFPFEKWKVKTAIGGGPVLVQNGQVKITNEEELKFTGKAINDKHPRTCMGYTADGYFIIMAIQGRSPGVADGATLEQEARLLVALGCVEALNLDGGGSSCLLVNGKETIKPSDKAGQRAVPAVFIINKN